MQKVDKLKTLGCFSCLEQLTHEYAANSGLLRKRRPSSPPIFGRGGGEEASSNPKMGREERGLLLPYRYQQFVEKFVEKERSPKEKKLSKMVPK